MTVVLVLAICGGVVFAATRHSSDRPTIDRASTVPSGGSSPAVSTTVVTQPAPPSALPGGPQYQALAKCTAVPLSALDAVVGRTLTAGPAQAGSAGDQCTYFTPPPLVFLMVTLNSSNPGAFAAERKGWPAAVTLPGLGRTAYWVRTGDALYVHVLQGAIELAVGGFGLTVDQYETVARLMLTAIPTH